MPVAFHLTSEKYGRDHGSIRLFAIYRKTEPQVEMVLSRAEQEQVT